MLFVIDMMTAATAMIAFAPTYGAIGVAAPLIIVVARLLQGFVTGGEFASGRLILFELRNNFPTGLRERLGLYRAAKK